MPYMKSGMDFAVTLTSPDSGEVVGEARIPASAGDNYTRLVETLYRMSGGDIGTLTLEVDGRSVTIPLFCPMNHSFIGQGPVMNLAKLLYSTSVARGRITISLPSGGVAFVSVKSDTTSDKDLAAVTEDESLGESRDDVVSASVTLRRGFVI